MCAVSLSRIPLARLGQLVRARRGYLGLDLEPAARSQGMSKDTWRKVERGEAPVRAPVYGRIEAALGWPEGSILAFLEGGPDPAPAPPIDEDPDVMYEVGKVKIIAPQSFVEMLEQMDDRGLAELEAIGRALLEQRRAADEHPA